MYIHTYTTRLCRNGFFHPSIAAATAAVAQKASMQIYTAHVYTSAALVYLRASAHEAFPTSNFKEIISPTLSFSPSRKGIFARANTSCKRASLESYSCRVCVRVMNVLHEKSDFCSGLPQARIQLRRDYTRQKCAKTHSSRVYIARERPKIYA